MVRIKGYKIRGLPFLIGFLVTVIFFVIAFDFIGIQINDNVTIAIFGFGLMTGGFISMWRKGLLHQGHFSIIVGLIFLVVGIVFVGGSFDVPVKDTDGTIIVHEKQWQMSPQEVGVFVLLAVVGAFSLVSGIKQAFQNQYFWGRRG